jgi:hypothetical protein
MLTERLDELRPTMGKLAIQFPEDYVAIDTLDDVRAFMLNTQANPSLVQCFWIEDEDEGMSADRLRIATLRADDGSARVSWLVEYESVSGPTCNLDTVLCREKPSKKRLQTCFIGERLVGVRQECMLDIDFALGAVKHFLECRQRMPDVIWQAGLDVSDVEKQPRAKSKSKKGHRK